MPPRQNQQQQQAGQQQQQAPRPPGRAFRGLVPSKTWHRVVLAEFLAVVLIITAQGLLAPGPVKTKAGTGQPVTVSFAPPLVRLTAACVLFFALALMTSGEKSGKLAAAFGALVLAGAALNAGPMWSVLGKALGGPQIEQPSLLPSGGPKTPPTVGMT